jgi:hypothetical protein
VVEFTQSLQQRHRGIPVGHARGGDQHHQQAQAVHGQVPFAAATFFPPSRPRPSAPTVSAARRDCESTITAVGVRRQAYTAEQITF